MTTPRIPLAEQTDPWLTEKEAAAELRVSQGTVRKEREDGRLGYAQLRRRIFYPMSCINEYRAAITKKCANIDSSSDPALLDGTSPGLKGGAAFAYRQVRKITAKRSKSFTSSH